MLCLERSQQLLWRERQHPYHEARRCISAVLRLCELQLHRKFGQNNQIWQDKSHHILKKSWRKIECLGHTWTTIMTTIQSSGPSWIRGGSIGRKWRCWSGPHSPQTSTSLRHFEENCSSLFAKKSWQLLWSLIFSKSGKILAGVCKLMSRPY